MIEDGLFDRFPCDAIYGLHNGPGLPVGSFATRVGPMMAAGGSWQVTFTGTGGHGGFTPHEATDVTVVLGHFLLGLQTIVSRNVVPGETAVISVGSIHGGDAEASNVMPSKIVVRGTMRCYEDSVRDVIETRMHALADAFAGSSGCEAKTALRWFMPAVVNHREQVEVAVAAARQVFDPAMVDDDIAPVTAGEDFSEMLRVRPGAFAWIGNGVAEDGSYHPVHTPLFDFNDAPIPLGAAYWLSVVQEELAP